MDNDNVVSDIEKYALRRIAASKYPNDYHTFRPGKCSTCGVVPMELTIEHHTGSKTSNFRGVIIGQCSKCGKKENVLKFTGKHREFHHEEKSVCKCGEGQFIVGECERIEREDGMMGFFDEGVLVGKCIACGRYKTIVHTD